MRQLQRKGQCSSAPSGPSRLAAHAQTHRVAPLALQSLPMGTGGLYNQLVLNGTPGTKWQEVAPKNV